MEALKLVVNEKTDTTKKKHRSSTIDKVDKTLTEELFIALCSPIGSLKEIVVEKLAEIIEIYYNYSVEIIKLSEYIDEYNFSTTNLQKVVNKDGRTPIFLSLIHI